MSATENNKLLAEFLGLENLKDECFSHCYRSPIDNEFTGLLLFDTDWNWIMPVVEKILDTSLNLDTMEMYYQITDSIPRLDHVHEACVMFVKWYNENK